MRWIFESFLLHSIYMKGDFYNHDAVAEIINDYCKSNKINEEGFAKIIGIHPTSLSRIKKGKMCSPENLQKIAVLGNKELKDLVRNVPENIKKQIGLSA